MTPRVVVLGAGYAGTGAVTHLEERSDEIELVWISKTDHHFLLHEAHRVIRTPGVSETFTIPVVEIKSPRTSFIRGEVVGVDIENRTVPLADGQEIEYDYLVLALGSETAFHGIPGLVEHALTLKSREDALTVHERLTAAVEDSTPQEPARVVIGGAGLSGIQSAGEIAEFRDAHGIPIEIGLIEAESTILPGEDASLQRTVRTRLTERGIDVRTDRRVTEARADTVRFADTEPYRYDVFLWTGGIVGPGALGRTAIETNRERARTNVTFQTSDERVFAIGDTAHIEQNDRPIPSTAQAAWQAADVAGANVLRAIDGRRLRKWVYRDRGTLLSIGETAIAHDIELVPVRTFDGPVAKFLKKAAAARWIAHITSPGRAVGAWGAL